MRAAEFDAVPLAQAARVYARYVRVVNTTWRENKQLQDFLFRYIAREAGRLGLPVHSTRRRLWPLLQTDER